MFEDILDADIQFMIMIWNMIVGNIILAIPVVIMLIYLVLEGIDKIRKHLK